MLTSCFWQPKGASPFNLIELSRKQQDHSSNPFNFVIESRMQQQNYSSNLHRVPPGRAEPRASEGSNEQKNTRARGLFASKSTAALSGCLSTAVHGVEHLVRQQEEPLSTCQERRAMGSNGGGVTYRDNPP